MEQECILCARGLKISGLVENIVGRQQHFVLNKCNAAVVEKRGGVGGRFSRGPVCVCCVTDDGGDRQLLRQAGQFPLISRYELRTLDQIEWQIAAQAQLGKDSQIGPALLGELGQFQDLGGIPGEVADGGIELCERNLHMGGS